MKLIFVKVDDSFRNLDIEQLIPIPHLPNNEMIVISAGTFFTKTG